VIVRAGGPAWDAEGFARLVEATRRDLAPATAAVISDAARVLTEAHEVEAALDRAGARAGEPAFADIRTQFSALVYPGFISATGAARLCDLVRYLRAIRQRMDKVAADPVRDAERMATVHRVADAYRDAVQALPPSRRAGQDVRDVRWMIEELRVSLFAQTLGTPIPVSEKRILAALDRLTDR
jgi:ATP-dependent helicase HrpA